MNPHRRNFNHNGGGYYLSRLLVWQLAKLQLSPRQVSIAAGVSTHAVADALSGECKKLSTLWSIASALRLKWEYLFKLDLPDSQFWRAVLNGDSESVR